ncbi:MAG: GNAT family N-acetyltransferase [Dehalococcoidia bacterium]|nr:GNAT family N-acetyltransferase [Dehalococcoidia bacterium]
MPDRPPPHPSVEIRPITAEELHAWQRHVARSFGRAPNDEHVDRLLRPHMRYEDSLAAFDGGEMVATAHHEPAPITLPGGRVLDCVGVTRVGVATTHRRQGVLSAMMQHQLWQAHEQSNPLAALWASETPIYGRFGYGLATVHDAYSIDTRDAGFAWWAPDTEGSVRFLSATDAVEVMRPLFDVYATSRPGGMPRLPYRWHAYTEDSPDERGGASPMHYVAYTSPEGEREGYATYRLKSEWPDHIPAYRLTVDEMVALTPRASAALWRYLLSVDLVGVVEANDQPLDAALPWLLSDYRRLKRRPSDGLYLRILDPEVALTARTYPVADRLVLQLDDRLCPWADGRFALDAAPEGAHVARTDAVPDLLLRPAALGTLLLGTERASVLAAVGLIEERRPGALARADEMFRSTPAPHCLNHF